MRPQATLVAGRTGPLGPPEGTGLLLKLFQHVEQGRPWPAQLTMGIVSALEKTPNAAAVQQYRPITVLPVAYRTWGSCGPGNAYDTSPS